MRFYLVTAAVLLNECNATNTAFCTDFTRVDQENAIVNEEGRTCCIRAEDIIIQFERDITGGANNFFAA